MTEMIWRATDADGQCYEYRSQPKKELGNFYSQPGTQSADYFGHEKPPPGECRPVRLKMEVIGG